MKYGKRNVQVYRVCGRPPRGGRGLKYSVRDGDIYPSIVAPLAGGVD